MYVLMAENCKSITIIKSIYTNRTQSMPSIIIVQGKQHIASWYNEKLTGNKLVLLSNFKYTSNQLGLIFLDHFITSINAGPNKPIKVLLMDSHTSHTTLEFIIQATIMNIHPY